MRVVAEYRRLLYLVTVAGGEITPSDEVDQAWHLHLTYTRAYWHDLCRDLLGFELHHNPTRGGAAELSRFENQYRDTLALYARVFGEKPPADIWPPAERRFEAVGDFVRVDLGRAWLLPKPGRVGAALALLLPLPMLLAACSDSLADRDI